MFTRRRLLAMLALVAALCCFQAEAHNENEQLVLSSSLRHLPTLSAYQCQRRRLVRQLKDAAPKPVKKKKTQKAAEKTVKKKKAKKAVVKKKKGKKDVPTKVIAKANTKRGKKKPKLDMMSISDK